MKTNSLWQLEYTLKLKFARTYIDIALAEGTEKGLLQTAYKTQDLRGWAIKRIRDLTKEAIKVRGGRNISGYALEIAKRLQKELIDAEMWKEIR
jgi:hypothetical protein